MNVRGAGLPVASPIPLPGTAIVSEQSEPGSVLDLRGTLEAVEGDDWWTLQEQDTEQGFFAARDAWSRGDFYQAVFYGADGTRRYYFEPSGEVILDGDTADEAAERLAERYGISVAK